MMKENYIKIALFALIAIVAIEGYYLYDLKRTTQVEAAPLALTSSSAQPTVAPGTLLVKAGDPFAEMERLQREMERNFRDFDHFFQDDDSFGDLFARFDRTPRFDMKKKDNKYVITLEIPGSDKHSIDINVKDGRLSVVSKISEENEDNTTTYYRHERRTSDYRREISLPKDADEQSLKSKYKDGLLVISFDKKA